MYSCMFLSLVDVSPDGLHIYLALVSTALLGVGRQGVFSSHMFTPAIWIGWHLPIGLFIFKRCIPTPWIFACTGFSAVSDLNRLLRASLCSWGSFTCSVSPAFLEGVPKLLVNFSHNSFAIWLVCPVRFPQASLILLPDIRLSDRSSVGAYVGSCLSLCNLWWQGL